MQNHIDQANHNRDFHTCIEDNFSQKFCDWKITVLFYVALHYLKALASKRGIDIGETHYDIEKSVNPDRPGSVMKITRSAWREYKNLFNYSRTARYEGITEMNTFQNLKEIDHGYCVLHLENFKKYIEGQGIILDNISLNEE